MGDSTQASAAGSECVSIGGEAVDAAYESCIAVGFLGLVNIIACREEEHRLAVCSLNYLAHVSRNAALTSKNAQVQSFQMCKVSIIAFNGHNSFPFLHLVAVMQGVNDDIFRMECTLLNQRDNLIGTADNNVVTSEYLHQHARMIVVTI